MIIVTSPHAHVVYDDSGNALDGGDPESGDIAKQLCGLIHKYGCDCILIDARDYPACTRTQREATELETHTKTIVAIHAVDFNRNARKGTHFDDDFTRASGTCHVDIHSCPSNTFSAKIATMMTTSTPTNRVFEQMLLSAAGAAAMGAKDAETFMRDYCSDKDCSGLLVNAKPDTPAAAIEFSIGKTEGRAALLDRIARCLCAFDRKARAG